VNEHEAPDPQAALPLARSAPYELRGNFLEVCDCHTICPCWTGRHPDEDECTGVFAWAVESGRIDGVDVAGRVTVSVSTHSGHREMAKQRVMLFVDDGASDAQTQALAGAFSGLYGGPLGDLAGLLGELLGVERLPIQVEFAGRRSMLTVGRRIAAEAHSVSGANGKPTTLSDAKLSSVLGSPAEVGISRRFKVGLPGHGIDIDLRGRSAMRGRFDYLHK
jgi:hypothetical protein